ncbi:hypothetical protein BC835DRAFT_259635 [Cytidiella melzeri]|nr:hypothetical protein BC835DRAFT_259635 [Cytidiella melzeri]
MRVELHLSIALCQPILGEPEPHHRHVQHAHEKQFTTNPSTTTAAEEAAALMPHLPHVPVWAGPGFTSTRTGSRAPMPYRPHSPTLNQNQHLHPDSALLNRRASFTPSVRSNRSVSPPYPPFFAHSSKNSSASSIPSSSADSDVPDIAGTPGLSRTSSVTESEEDILKTPPGTIAGVGSMRVVSEGTKDLHIRSVQPVVKNSNGVVAGGAGGGGGGGNVGAASGVVVEVVETRGHRKEGSEGGKSVVSVGGGEGVNAKMGRKGTLKRAFGRVFGGRSGSVSGVKV